MNISELNDAIDTPKTINNKNFNMTINSVNSNKNKFNGLNNNNNLNINKPETIKLNSGRNSMLDKK
jgi:hypothetical protein